MRLLFQYSLLFVYSVLYIAGLELARFIPRFWWIAMAGMAIITLLLMWYLCKKRLNRRWLQFSVGPAIFFFASFWFAMFLSRPLFYHVFAVVIAAIFWIYFEQALLFFYYSLKYYPHTLENFSYYIGLLSFFFLMSGLYGFMILLHTDTWILVMIAAAGVFMISFEIFWNQKIEWRESWLFNLIIGLIIVELFVGISFLPSGYYVNAGILALLYYLLVGLSKASLSGYMTRRNILIHTLIAGIGLLLLLFTAQWT